MNHESNKSPSLGMISTATRTTATVSALSSLTNGNTVAQSANSGFAAALRKLAKQAEDPRGSAINGESSPVSSPATNHSSPISTPKRGSLGLLLGPNRGHGVSSTPPVVTIAPTKTSNGLWRAEGRQVESSVQRVGAENSQSHQDRRTPPVPSSHPLAQSFGHTPSSIMQDPRIQNISLPGQMHSVVPSSAVPEEYLRALRPFATSEELRLTSLPLSLDPAVAAHAAAAAAAAAYYHPAYLHHPLSLPRMDESLCLSALRSQFYSVPAGGTFSPLHPSALQLHMPGGRYPGEMNHTAFTDRLQMENELRQREREQEREREKEREREAGLEREREEERERELDRQKERQRDRQQQMVRVAEGHYLAELQARRAGPEDRARPGERLTPNRLDKNKDSDHPSFPALKPMPLQSGHHSSRVSVPHPMPSLLPSHLGKHRAAASSGIHGALAAAMMSQRASDEAWLTRQRAQGQEREGPLVVGLRSPGKGVESRRDSHRTSSVYHSLGGKDASPCLGAPPPLISPKVPPHPPAPPTTLWNPASLVDTPSSDSRRKLNPATPPSRPPPGLTRADRHLVNWGERIEDGTKRTSKSPERYHSVRGAGLMELWTKTEQERAIQSLYPRHHVNHLHHRPSEPLSAPSDPELRFQSASPPLTKERQAHVSDSMLVYDEVLQQHRRLLSKLDLEEKRRKEAREGGYYYDLDESYNESDEEEVKAHLRRVTEQPPLKLDTSSEKVDFLRSCGLTTLARRDELLAQMRRKRRRMMRERSVSPPAVQGKRKITSPSTPTAPLITPYSAEQMDSTPELQEKKDFLLMFNLTHVSPQQRRDKASTEELLRAIQRKTVTLDTIRYNPRAICRSLAAPSTDSSTVLLLPQSNGHLYPDSPSPSPPNLHKYKHLHNDTLKPSVDSQAARVPPPLKSHHDKTELAETQPSRKLQPLQNGLVAPQKKEPSSVQNGRSQPWERFTPEAFAQHFHQAVLQSTHTLHNKESSNCIPEVRGKTERPPPHSISQLKTLNHAPQHTHVNGHHFHPPAMNRDTPAAWDRLSDEEEEEESGQEDEEEQEAPRKWRGIEAVFEAYQEYVDDRTTERQVLHSQCKRLEAQNYNLTRTAEHLSLTVGELVSQRQKVREERDRLQAQLEHFRRCLTLPNIHWGRSQVNGYTPR